MIGARYGLGRKMRDFGTPPHSMIELETALFVRLPSIKSKPHDLANVRLY